MTRFNYCWTTIRETHEGIVDDFEQAIAVFETAQRAESSAPPMVEYWDDRGRALAIGAGLTESVATFQFTLDPPYYGSKGTDSGGVVDYIYGNEPTEFLRENVIPVSSALACLRDFFSSTELPPSNAWEAV